VHLQPYYRQRGFVAGQYPEAEAYAESAITLPLYAAMTDAQQDFSLAALREVYESGGNSGAVAVSVFRGRMYVALQGSR